MNKLIESGLVAVLVSRGFGAGWSTWNYEYPDMLYDADVARMLLDGAPLDEIEKLAESKWPDAYLGGLDGLYVYWMSPGTKFRVDEYDGAESVEILDEIHWNVA